MSIPAPAFGTPTTVAPTQPAPSQQAPAGFQMDEYVGRYVRVRDAKKELAKRHAGEMAPYNEALDQLYAAILDALNRGGVESSRTKSGTAYKSMRTSYTVADPAALRQWLEANNRFDLLETRVSKEAIENMLQGGDSLPPGLKVSSEVTLKVNR